MTFTTRPTLVGTFGMVSSTHWIASQSAMSVLERGGNAFDAAACAGFVLHVVEPHLNGPGGDMPAIVATADDPTPRVLCGQGPAPAGATIEHYRAEGLDQVPGSGLLAAAIPGAVDAWLVLLRDHGTWELSDVLEPAIGYAEAGHPVLPAVSATIERVAGMFTEHWPTSASTWLPRGKAPTPGSLVTNPAYAATLRRLLAEGAAAGADRVSRIEGARRAWSHGFVADAVDRFARGSFLDSSGAAHAGVITGEDLGGFEATWESAVTLDRAGATVAKTGAWGQGPVLLQSLQMMDALGDPSELDLLGAEGVHTTTEVMKLAFADREAFYGDVDVPLADLLDPAYAAQRAALVGADASMEIRPGSPGGRTPVLPHGLGETASAADDSTVGEPTVSDRAAPTAQRGDTCHVDVVDRFGNMISATPSGGWLQSSPTIPELGFCLGTRAQMFRLQEGLPASLAPGRRPRTTLSPTLVLRDGAPSMACGTPGGDQQDQWQLLFLLRVLAQGNALQDAIDAPAWHSEAVPSSFYPRGMQPGVLVIEDRIDPAVARELSARGHGVQLGPAWSEGRLCAVTRDPATGVLRAGANPRGMQGYAVGR
ncbi:gamma-glutamyltransferase family protein [Allobranchiibius sp. GilTou38]|uniref:gamma-glutamyltransferase family protein n=1 Tax=Allobranchiibius sp. GilTou38 TaxID=2815210 RepID=UPI001AA0C2CD|nr:gamma-glutamyltransferase family protein [Allobranchiibius sp. GilTou38]MBO1766187.1 gamma-glutamyltransferase family protein [Allobranchiibius sp. GilTou38]